MRSCLTCKHNFPDHDNEPCTACFGGSMWEPDENIELELKAKAVDLYNAIVGVESEGLTIKFSCGVKMDVTLSKDTSLCISFDTSIPASEYITFGANSQIKEDQ